MLFLETQKYCKTLLILINEYWKQPCVLASFEPHSSAGSDDIVFERFWSFPTGMIKQKYILTCEHCTS